jgi:ABC-2 type transport system ATP-binding protein
MRSSDTQEVRFGAPAGLDTAALAGRLQAAVTEVSPGEYLVGASGTPALIASLTGWLAEQDLPLGDLRVGRQTLEDVFLRLTATADAEVDQSSSASAGGRRSRRSRR